jgi:hypothetical protein
MTVFQHGKNDRCRRLQNGFKHRQVVTQLDNTMGTRESIFRQFRDIHEVERSKGKTLHQSIANPIHIFAKIVHSTRQPDPSLCFLLSNIIKDVVRLAPFFQYGDRKPSP